MARRGSAIAGNRAVGVAPSTGPALPPGSVPSPLAQSLASGMGVNGGAKVDQTGSWGNLYGGTGLPRPSIDFTDGAFGPFSPIVPVPVNPAEPDTGLPLARREEYRVGWNLPVGQPGSEGLKLADFGTLRTLADLYSVARACIQFLKSQISSLEWDVAPTSEAAKAMRNDKGAMKDFGQRRGQAVKFFRRPDPDYFNWQSWMSAVMEEVLVFDALSIVLRPKWGRGLKKGLLWSDLDSLNLISGPTVRPLYDMNGATPRPPAPAYQQYLYGVPRVDLMTMIRERDLDEGRLRESALGRYTNSQLLYLPLVPRRWTPYGFPPVERALIPVLAGLSKQGYQLDYFKEGTVPAVYISPGGDLTPNQIRELQDALNAIAGDPAWHHKILVLPSGSHTEPQRPTPLADTFDEIVMTQVCSAFGVQPMQIGISPRATGGLTSPAMANNMAKASSNTQDMSTLQPTLLFLTGIMDTILQDVCGQDDMRFVFAGMQEEEDEETTTNLLVNQVSHALITIDEARDKLGLQPYGITESTEPGFLTPTGFMFLSQPAAPVLPGMDGGQGNDGSTGGDAGGNPGPQKPAPPQYGPRPNGPANSTQGRPQQTPDKEPGEKIPANNAAEGAADAKAKPDRGGVTKAATGEQEPEQEPEPTSQPSATAEAARVALEAVIAKQVADIVTDAWRGTVTLLGAVEQITEALGKAYYTVMKAASRAAVHTVSGVVELADDVLRGLAQQRAAQQRAFSLHMVQSAINTQTPAPPAWIPARSKLYAETLAGAEHEAHGKTVEASEPDAKIIWRLGETEHCPLCLARDGQEYDFDTLPGYPGDGGFGGPICEGGPNCGCHLEYRKGERIVDTLGNTQRPESVGYYQQQNRDIQARRDQMAAERADFVAGLPNTLGSDGTSAQMRALARDDMRRQLASLANARIRSTGGYGGVSVEPEDIPAQLIASLIPQYGPIPADVPLTDVMNAVESMFAGKFAAADVTKTAFSSLLLSVVGDAVAGWERAVVAELEACARHLDKGRPAGSWEPRRITPIDVATLADLLRTGAVSRADAVKQAVENRRRVDNSGQVVMPEDEGPEPSHPVQEQTEDNPAGGGGYVLLPHDAHGIYRDFSDLRPLDERAQGKTYAEIGKDAVRRALKAASDPGDPNPVEAEHVYNQMLANYPPKAIQWVKKARWIGPMAVDPQRADTADEGSWAATHEPARVAHFAKKYKKGKDIKPGITVQEPGQHTVKIIDGHHRFLGARKAGKPYMAYVGFVDADGGPWDETHASQFHQGADPANKVGPKGYVHGWHFVGVAPKDGHWADSAGAAIEREHPGVKMNIYAKSNGNVVLSRIEVPKDQRGSGVGSKIMRQITQTADDHGHTIELTPSKDFGGSVPRLKQFYGRHGFVPNKGRNRDFEISEDMYRLPQKADKAASGTPGLTKRSGMVSIDLPDGLIPKVPGGVDDTQHITLAYLGKNVDDGTLEDVLRTAKHVAANTRPFTITAGGVDSFPPSDGSGGKVPAFVPVDVTDELRTLREPFAQYHASEHQDFKPHITLAYLDDGEPLPAPVPQVTIPVNAVHVHLGGEVFATIPLGAANKSAETAALASEHRPLGTHGLWGDKMAQLPAYIQNIAHAMIRDGHDESEAIQLAIGAVKRWAEGGGKVTPEVRAAAAAAVAEWEKLKAEHSKTKALVPDVVKVGPHGYIHGWIFVGVPGVGDVVRHPDKGFGKGTVEGHDDKHVTVRFQSGKTHTFDVHRDATEKGHFTERGKLEHPGARSEVEEHADKVWNDPEEAKNLTDVQLGRVRDELLKRHEKIGAWGDEADRMDKVRTAVAEEQFARKFNAYDAADYHNTPGAAERASAEDLEFTKRNTERIARERGIDPDLVEGHRAARVELARRQASKDGYTMKNWPTWNAKEHLHIFGGTPEQQVAVSDAMTDLTADVDPLKSAMVKHVALRPQDAFKSSSTMADYHMGTHEMRVNADKMFAPDVDKDVAGMEQSGWFTKTNAYQRDGGGLRRTIDHEFGHHLDSIMTPEDRERMFSHLSEVIGTKDNYDRTSTRDAAFNRLLQQYNADEFVKNNKATIVKDIGTYASTNSYELLAELWAQYHGQKLNGSVPINEYTDTAGDIVGHYMAGHTTKSSDQL